MLSPIHTRHLSSVFVFCLSVCTSSGFPVRRQQQQKLLVITGSPFGKFVHNWQSTSFQQARLHSFVGSRRFSSRQKEPAGFDLNVDQEGDTSPQLGAWVPIGSISCLQGLGPTDIEVFGRKFAVWESTQKGSKWSVIVDECPHRSSPLSLGRIDPHTNCLECPYHGWQFDTEGTLQKIPHLEPNAELRPEARSVQSFETHLTGDLLWAFFPSSFHGESFPKSVLPEHYYKDLTHVIEKNLTFYTQELPFSFDFLAEK